MVMPHKPPRPFWYSMQSNHVSLSLQVPSWLVDGGTSPTHFGVILIAFTGMVPYEVALTAVFVEGFVFVGLTILGIRQWLAR